MRTNKQKKKHILSCGPFWDFWVCIFQRGPRRGLPSQLTEGSRIIHFPCPSFALGSQRRANRDLHGFTWGRFPPENLFVPCFLYAMYVLGCVRVVWGVCALFWDVCACDKKIAGSFFQRNRTRFVRCENGDGGR